MFITNYIVQHIRREFLLTERSKKGSYDQNPYENMDWDNVYIQAEENVSIGLWVLKAILASDDLLPKHVYSMTGSIANFLGLESKLPNILRICNRIMNFC